MAAIVCFSWLGFEGREGIFAVVVVILTLLPPQEKKAASERLNKRLKQRGITVPEGMDFGALSLRSHLDYVCFSRPFACALRSLWQNRMALEPP